MPYVIMNSGSCQSHSGQARWDGMGSWVGVAGGCGGARVVDSRAVSFCMGGSRLEYYINKLWYSRHVFVPIMACTLQGLCVVKM